MKRITVKLVAPILLIFSIIFGVLSICSPLFDIPSTHAIGENADNPGTSDGAISNPFQNPSNDEEGNDGDDPGTSNGAINNPFVTPGTSNGAIERPGNATIEGSGSLIVDEEGNITNSDSENETNNCKDQAGSLSWIICPTMNTGGSIIDSLYNAIYAISGDFLFVQPLESNNTSPIYAIWKYARSLTNIVFVIVLLFVIFSQITGIGISNYGIKRILPRLIVTVILVNISYVVCAVMVDVSNIIGASLRDFFLGLQGEMIGATAGTSAIPEISIAALVTAVIGGGTVAGLAIGAAGGIGTVFWMLAPLLIGGIVAVLSGLLTLAARQALIALLIMVAPLAFIAYLLPNTERWFTQWKNLLTRMLVFYPMFSFLFGASHLAGAALIAAAQNEFGVILGLAVQIFPLFFSWSLMKMSGTILQSFNAGLRRLATPLQRHATNYSMEKAEQSRQNYFAHGTNTSARLRSYLDYRRELRLQDTRNAAEIRHDRAVERTMNKSSSIVGRDELGNVIWTKNPNRYARTAKSASYWHTMASTATMSHQNTLTAYGRHFTDNRSQRISDQHAEAFLDSMAQHFLAANEAEADQKWLLDRYLAAATNQNRNRYEYNRLIEGAAGGLDYQGESSIMGQVIQNSSDIENRRRTQARIIATKFGVSKVQFRGMTFNKAHISDNGYETDANGNVIEDSEYNLIEFDKDGKPTGYRRQEWQYYIGVHKEKGISISKEEYDALSDEERKDYKKVRYFDILNDEGDPVQRVFDDDAGYMKELLRDDIAIGDPINRRYLTELGVKHTDNESTGSLRRYHSTVTAAMLETRYKEHDGTVTPMLTSQANNGYITTKGQFNIGALQSLTVASKAGSFLTNDGVIINEISDFIKAAKDDVLFAKYFPDEDVASYRNVNGVHLDGWRKIVDAAGNESWLEINHNDPTLTLEEKKNLIRHKIIPKAAAKLVGLVDRKLTPGVIDNMKPDGLNALYNMVDTLGAMAIKNAQETKFEKRFNGDFDIFDSRDPDDLRYRVGDIKQRLASLLGDNGDTLPSSGINPRGGGHGGGGNHTPSPRGGDSGTNPYRRPGIKQVKQRKQRDEEALERYRQRNDRETIINNLNGYFETIYDYESLASQLLDYFHETECLQPLQYNCQDIIDAHRSDDSASSTLGAIQDITSTSERAHERIEDLRIDIMDLIEQAEFS